MWGGGAWLKRVRDGLGTCGGSGGRGGYGSVIGLGEWEDRGATGKTFGAKG